VLKPTTVSVGRVGMTSRMVATFIGLGLLLAGTVVGQDDDFPFGPFRMYSTSNRATGVVTVLTLEAQTTSTDWTTVAPSPSSVGMNVAEFEGQQQRFIDDPNLLGAVASSHQRLNPEADQWTGLRLIRRSTMVVDRVPTGEVTEEVIAEWHQS
jgi:hypothetical protein